MSTAQHPPFKNMIEMLQYRATFQPDDIAYTFLHDGEHDETSLTYRDLDQRVRCIASLLQSHQSEGERILLLYQPGIDYLAAFFGCLYAKAIAVPVYPPRPNHHLDRFEAIVLDAAPKLALTSQNMLDRLQRQFLYSQRLTHLHLEATDTLAPDYADHWQQPAIPANMLAFLQYTSGSTGKPKGVMVSHDNLLHNHRLLQQATQHPDDAPYVSWLPLFHDMGLIGNALQSVYRGVPCILMAPSAFLQKPVRWLQAISRFKAYTSFAPNFAYELCVNKITPEQQATLDLREWKVAINGAEPVRNRTIERFSDFFAPCGFRREAFLPAYGLAEATLLVSSTDPDQLPGAQTFHMAPLEHNALVETAHDGEPGRTLVSVGHSWLEQKIRIVDPVTHTLCPPGHIGEIWISGPSVAQGYWKQPELTRETFCASLAHTYEGPFLRTGDLGCLYGERLYVTGRLKDLIIIRGRNLYAQDIEETLEQSHHALRPGGGAAFCIEEDEEERLVVVQELKREYMRGDYKAIAEAIQNAIGDEYQVGPYAVVLIKPGTLPKTSSGKVQRGITCKAFLEGTLSPVYEEIQHHRQQTLDALPGTGADQFVAPRNTQEAAVAQIWCECLNVKRVGIYDKFLEVGGQSVIAMQIIARINELFQVNLSTDEVFTNPTIIDLLELIKQAQQQTKQPALMVASREARRMKLSSVLKVTIDDGQNHE